MPVYFRFNEFDEFHKYLSLSLSLSLSFSVLRAILLSNFRNTRRVLQSRTNEDNRP